ncbi:MAG: hypothetical protein ACLUUO_13190 [Sellimonas intestinalis]
MNRNAGREGNKESGEDTEALISITMRNGENIPLGKVLAVIQLLISVIFVGILFNSGMIPMKYLATGAAVLFVLFALTSRTSVCQKQRQ